MTPGIACGIALRRAAGGACVLWPPQCTPRILAITGDGIRKSAAVQWPSRHVALREPPAYRQRQSTLAATTSTAALTDDAADTSAESSSSAETDSPADLPLQKKRRPGLHHKYNVLCCGTDNFAFRVFHRLSEVGVHTHIAFVTPPAKEHHVRGKKQFREAPVRDWAIQKQQNHYTAPQDLAQWKLPAPFDKYNEDNVLITASFGRLIPPEMMANFPKMQCLNVHPSPLPHLRGAAPIPWAIAKRKRQTGVTIQTLGPTFDSGDILVQQPISLRRDAVTPSLEIDLKEIAADLLVDVMKRLPTYIANAKPQDAAVKSPAFSHAPAIRPRHAHIKWDQWSAGDIEARCRALAHLRPLSTYLQNCGNEGTPGSTRDAWIIDARAIHGNEVEVLQRHYPEQYRHLMQSPPGTAKWFEWPYNIKTAQANQGLIIVKCVEQSKYHSETDPRSLLRRAVDEMDTEEIKREPQSKEKMALLTEARQNAKALTFAVGPEPLLVVRAMRAKSSSRVLWPRKYILGVASLADTETGCFRFVEDRSPWEQMDTKKAGAAKKEE